MSLRLPSNRVAVRRSKPSPVTKGGLVIPEHFQERVNRGIVIAVGPGKQSERNADVILKNSVEVGDDVLFGPFEGVPFKLDGEEITMLANEDILAIVEPEAASADHGKVKVTKWPSPTTGSNRASSTLMSLAELD